MLDDSASARSEFRDICRTLHLTLREKSINDELL
jgi:hypothetical protein